MSGNRCVNQSFFDAFLMGENENVYSLLQSITADEFTSILKEIPEPRILVFPEHMNLFIRTSFPEKAINAINAGFQCQTTRNI